MAWVANPFSYIAINAIIPVIPRLAEQFNLSPMFAGFFCSVWFFSRAAGFALLWQWTGWHYRFRWLIGTYAAMAVAFVVILAGGSLWVSVLAQVVFGLGVALTYYSSLYYSMDVGDTKGEHGGFHEAAIGAGICVGPAVGAASLRFFPQHERMNVWAVALLLTAGLAWLLVLRWRKRRE
jgi:predicted MFS family arabinose efflux permease